MNFPLVLRVCSIVQLGIRLTANIVISYFICLNEFPMNVKGFNKKIVAFVIQVIMTFAHNFLFYFFYPASIPTPKLSGPNSRNVPNTLLVLLITTSSVKTYQQSAVKW